MYCYIVKNDKLIKPAYSSLALGEIPSYNPFVMSAMALYIIIVKYLIQVRWLC